MIRPCTAGEILRAPNIDRIAEEYAAESSIRGLPHPLAKLELYEQLEAAGALRGFGAFVDGLPVGFIAVLTVVIPHYSVRLSNTESFFVLRQYRRTGAGLKLLHAAEDWARELGAPGLLVSAPLGGVLAEVLPHVGYRQTNAVFFKGFDDV